MIGRRKASGDRSRAGILAGIRRELSTPDARIVKKTSDLIA
jgi:hypothetical protein